MMAKPLRSARPCLAGLLLVLAACAGEPVPVAATCPEVLLVADASRITLRAAGEGSGGDDIAFRSRFGSPAWSCAFLPGQNLVRVTLEFTLKVSKGPAAAGGDASMPVFVALGNPAGEIVAKRIVETEVRFPDTAAEVEVTDRVVQEFGYARMSDVAGHTLYIGFQIPPGQFAAGGAGS